MFVSFLKRLVGQDVEAAETQRRFDASLLKLGARKEELVGAAAAIATIIREVEIKQKEIAISPMMTGISGQYRLRLPSSPGEEPNDIRIKR